MARIRSGSRETSAATPVVAAEVSRLPLRSLLLSARRAPRHDRDQITMASIRGWLNNWRSRRRRYRSWHRRCQRRFKSGRRPQCQIVQTGLPRHWRQRVRRDGSERRQVCGRPRLFRLLGAPIRVRRCHDLGVFAQTMIQREASFLEDARRRFSRMVVLVAGRHTSNEGFDDRLRAAAAVRQRRCRLVADALVGVGTQCRGDAASASGQ